MEDQRSCTCLIWLWNGWFRRKIQRWADCKDLITLDHILFHQLCRNSATSEKREGKGWTQIMSDVSRDKNRSERIESKLLFYSNTNSEGAEDKTIWDEKVITIHAQMTAIRQHIGKWQSVAVGLLPRLSQVDFSRVSKELPGAQMELSAKRHDNLSDPRHRGLFATAIKRHIILSHYIRMIATSLPSQLRELVSFNQAECSKARNPLASLWPKLPIVPLVPNHLLWTSHLCYTRVIRSTYQRSRSKLTVSLMASPIFCDGHTRGECRGIRDRPGSKSTLGRQHRCRAIHHPTNHLEDVLVLLVAENQFFGRNCASFMVYV